MTTTKMTVKGQELTGDYFDKMAGVLGTGGGLTRVLDAVEEESPLAT